MPGVEVIEKFLKQIPVFNCRIKTSGESNFEKKAASLPHMDSSVVFARLQQMCTKSNNASLDLPKSTTIEDNWRDLQAGRHSCHQITSVICVNAPFNTQYHINDNEK